MKVVIFASLITLAGWLFTNVILNGRGVSALEVTTQSHDKNLDELTSLVHKIDRNVVRIGVALGVEGIKEVEE